LSLAENRSFVVNQKHVHSNDHNRKDDGNAKQHAAGQYNRIEYKHHSLPLPRGKSIIKRILGNDKSVVSYTFSISSAVGLRPRRSWLIIVGDTPMCHAISVSLRNLYVRIK